MHVRKTRSRSPGFHLPLNILFLVGQEVISIAGAADIVLTEQTVQGAAHLFPHRDLVQTDVVRHQDDDVVQIGLYVIHVAHQIQELQHIHVLRLDVRGKVILPSLGKDFFTPDGKQFFTRVGKQFFYITR